MRLRTQNDAGIVLVIVLLLLTLFSLVGVTFVVYTAETQCRQNPTAQIHGEGCIRTIGNDDRR
jgi:Tfp pilus assembly protein PilX